jgi:hypothetical protein
MTRGNRLGRRVDWRRWHARLRRAAALGPAEWMMLAEATATLVAVAVALRIVRFPRLAAWAMRATASARSEWTRERIEQVARMVAAAGRLTGLTCLTRSLALARMLARRGVATTVRIGVRTEHGALDAHAWVEWRGAPINDSVHALQPFAPFAGPLGDVVNV